MQKQFKKTSIQSFPDSRRTCFSHNPPPIPGLEKMAGTEFYIVYRGGTLIPPTSDSKISSRSTKPSRNNPSVDNP
jgi:hypothetical protein